MRNSPNPKVEGFRFSTPDMPSSTSDGNNGAFVIPVPFHPNLCVIASDGAGWDHVSVRVDSNPKRLPTWEEMRLVKELFFRDDETCVEFHPAKANYINHHPFVLHLWRPQHEALPLPEPFMVGPGPRISPRPVRRFTDMDEPMLKQVMDSMATMLFSVARAEGIERPLFCLLIFNDQAVGQYVSNASRDTMPAALREFAKKLEELEDVPR